MTQRNAQPETTECPGWGESCGNETAANAGLCPDCFTARLKAQAPE